MKKSSKSFMSEHSVEYFLAQRISRIFTAKSLKATPLFFSGTREGNSLGGNCFTNEQIRVIAIYPRRPKVAQIYDNDLFFKLNSAIVPAAVHLQNNGIPVFCGGPVITSLDDFGFDSPLFICELKYVRNSELNYVEDEFIHFNNINNEYITSDTLHNYTLIRENDIVDALNMHSITMTWREAVEIIKLRKLHDAPSYQAYIPRRVIIDVIYKPMFFIIR